jgi:hypothetical protein
MMSWLKDLHWSLYYEHGIRWVSKPPKREWRILLLPGMEPPPPQPGYTQVVTKLPEQMAGLMGGSQLPADTHPLYGLRLMAQQSNSDNPFLRDI